MHTAVSASLKMTEIMKSAGEDLKQKRHLCNDARPDLTNYLGS